jgi:hypothetical protein
VKSCFKDRLQQMQNRGLYDAIRHSWHSERPELPRLTTLRNHHAPDGHRAVVSISQPLPKLVEESFNPDALLNAPHCHSIHPGRTLAAIARDPLPRQAEVPWMCQPVPHVPPRFIGMALTPRVELSLNVEKPFLIGLIVGVHRLFLLALCSTQHLLPFAL